jgi:hypothetical protein
MPWVSATALANITNVVPTFQSRYDALWSFTLKTVQSQALMHDAKVKFAYGSVGSIEPTLSQI